MEINLYPAQHRRYRGYSLSESCGKCEISLIELLEKYDVSEEDARKLVDAFLVYIDHIADDAYFKGRRRGRIEAS